MTRGLEVQALGGAPGVHTKRWSGRADLEGRALDVANNDFLLRKLGKAMDTRALRLRRGEYRWERASNFSWRNGGRDSREAAR